MRQIFSQLLLAGGIWSATLRPCPAHAAPAPPADTAQVRALIQQARALGRAGQLDSARQAARQAQRLSQQLGFGAGQARALYTLGKLEMQPGNMPAAHRYLDAAVAQAQALPQPSALLAAALLALGQVRNEQDDYAGASQACQRALRLYQQLGDRASQARVRNGLGIIYSSRGDFPRALASLLPALDLAQQTHDSTLTANCLTNLGNVYFRRQEYEPARRYFAQALPLLRHSPNQGALVDCLANLAATYQSLHDYPTASGFYRQAIATSQAAGEHNQTGAILANYAELLATQNHLPEAQRTYEQALALLQAAGDLDNTASLLVNLADVHRRQGRPARAQALAIQALALARRVGSPQDLELANHLMAQLAKQRGDFGPALAYTEAAQAAHDSVFSQAKAEEMGRLQGDFQLSQERERRQALTHTSAAQAETLRLRQRQVRGLALGLAAVAVGGLVLGWLAVQLRRRNRLVEKQRAELAELNATKDRLFSIIGHDLRAPLHSLHTFVELLSGPPLPPERLRQYTGHLTQTLDQTLILLENLLSWAALQLRGPGPVRTESLSLAAAVEDAFDLLGPTATAAGLALRTTLAGTEWVQADPAAVRLVLRNLLSNALKFTPNGGQVTVATERRGVSWQLSVADTGQGLPNATYRQPLPADGLPRRAGAGRAPGAGLGLTLSRDYARRNGGELEVASAGPGQGTTFYLVLPVAVCSPGEPASARPDGDSPAAVAPRAPK